MQFKPREGTDEDFGETDGGRAHSCRKRARHEALIAGMTSDCFNDVVGVPKPFVGPEQTAERYRKHWEGSPILPYESAVFSARTKTVL